MTTPTLGDVVADSYVKVIADLRKLDVRSFHKFANRLEAIAADRVDSRDGFEKPNINPHFWIQALRINAHVSDCAEKAQVQINAANNIEKIVNYYESRQAAQSRAVVVMDAVLLLDRCDTFIGAVDPENGRYILKAIAEFKSALGESHGVS